MNLYFLRHGVTDLNRQIIFQGRIDTPLNDEGISQAELAANYINKSSLKFDKIYSSPLIRAIDTCRIATGIDKAHFITDERLLEIDCGPFEGKKIFPATDEMMAFLEAPFDNEPPNGIENMNSVKGRMVDVLNDIISSSDTSDNVLISSHGIALSALFHCQESRNVVE